MPITAEIETLLGQIQAAGIKPFHQSQVDEVRGVVASFQTMQKPVERKSQTMDIEYRPGTYLRIYQPNISSENLPVLVYYHGGGFVAGNLEVADETCHVLAEMNQHIVVSVDYRLAPEHPFPAAHLDAREGLVWTLENIQYYGGDPKQISLIGDSAGGNLAATTALWAKSEGIAIKKQILIYPVIQPDMESASRTEENGYLISQQDMDWFWKNYQVQDGHTVQYSPLQFKNLNEAPETLIITTEYEVSRDDAEYYGLCLIEKGVSTTIKRIQGGVHGIFWLSAVVPEHQLIRAEIAKFLR
ncbi:esterase [Acinetobacter sp. LoGeW2-3]|uniref:alpha/beta hydrolase n=1 Tax=Acinetobacter sp. LoGeW2-3 TaxID=1808001 RepID=UPI000C058AE0|nr:alpha/beta hydrolase [Acinetobacter sp. LoGeW2-3]ATO20162.1 esterase [Acinetobacter sp. LoGeW2-3]